nr:MAG TPA: hypothetical protein [Caudoviricetes sp.]
MLENGLKPRFFNYFHSWEKLRKCRSPALFKKLETERF